MYILKHTGNINNHYGRGGWLSNQRLHLLFFTVFAKRPSQSGIASTVEWSKGVRACGSVLAGVFNAFVNILKYKYAQFRRLFTFQTTNFVVFQPICIKIRLKCYLLYRWFFFSYFGIISALMLLFLFIISCICVGLCIKTLITQDYLSM